MKSDKVIAAAEAILEQWDTPNWKLTETTAKLMNDLRKAIDEAALSSEEPVAAMTKDYLGCEYVSMEVAGI